MSIGDPDVFVSSRPSAYVLVHVATTVPVEHVAVVLLSRTCSVHALAATTVVAFVHCNDAVIIAALVLSDAWNDVDNASVRVVG